MGIDLTQPGSWRQPPPTPMPRPSVPRKLLEFIPWFPDEDACFDYVACRRWPDGFRCPACRHDAARRLRARRLLQCASCRRQTSATAGLVMHRSKLPLLNRLLAAYFVAIDKRGLSAPQHQKRLDVGYEAAWAMLHRLRAAMVAPDRTRLAGIIEVDRPTSARRSTEGRTTRPRRRCS